MNPNSEDNYKQIQAAIDEQIEQIDRLNTAERESFQSLQSASNSLLCRLKSLFPFIRNRKG